MKIKSTVERNCSFHKMPSAPSNTPNYFTIPAGSTLELEDSMWNSSFANSPSIAASLSNGSLVMVEHAVPPVSVEDMVALIKDPAGVTLDSALEKASVQDLAMKLGVDLSAKLPKKKK